MYFSVSYKNTTKYSYKIVVTNEGSAAGYVKKVVDYLPKEAKFNSELNKDWFLAKDGNAYNSNIYQILINLI